MIRAPLVNEQSAIAPPGKKPMRETRFLRFALGAPSSGMTDFVASQNSLAPQFFRIIVSLDLDGACLGAILLASEDQHATLSRHIGIVIFACNSLILLHFFKLATFRLYGCANSVPKTSSATASRFSECRYFISEVELSQPPRSIVVLISFPLRTIICVAKL